MQLAFLQSDTEVFPTPRIVNARATVDRYAEHLD